MVIDNLLPAIKEKWPAWLRKKASNQMDNAQAHKNLNKNAQLITTLKEMAACGWEINFVLQPPNLSGTNIKNLALFCVMQSLQYLHEARKEHR